MIGDRGGGSAGEERQGQANGDFQDFPFLFGPRAFSARRCHESLIMKRERLFSVTKSTFKLKDVKVKRVGINKRLLVEPSMRKAESRNSLRSGRSLILTNSKIRGNWDAGGNYPSSISSGTLSREKFSCFFLARFDSARVCCTRAFSTTQHHFNQC
jgi:hypothetical protein